MGQANSDQALRKLVDAIVRDDGESFAQLLVESPSLAYASFLQGATRQEPPLGFLQEISYHIYAGDTALHIAAAAYRQHMVAKLLKAGANVHAKNRRGIEPLHAAAVGSPGAHTWNPVAQVITIDSLIQAGANPNAQNMDGATPLHRAVRTRCADAVRALLGHGADPAIRNKNGTTAIQLARLATGRSGSGSAAAKAQQQEIVLLLQAQ